MRPIQVAVLYTEGTGQGLPSSMGRASTVKCGEQGEPGHFALYLPWDREFYVEHNQANVVKVFMVPRESVKCWEPKCGVDVLSALSK